jgi:hypothetical protein
MAYSTDIYRDGNNVYVNLSLYNPNDALIPASIDVSLEKPIVERANEYQLSIIRFTCPLTNIPRYSLVNINMSVIIYYQNVNIIGQGSANVPTTPLDSISYFINLLNSACVQAYNNFVSAMAQIGKTLPSGTFPYFLYNTQTRLMAFVTPTFFLNGSIVPLPIDLYVSNDVFDFIYSFPSLPSFISGYSKLKINNIDYNLYTSPLYPSGNQSAYINYQEFSTDYEFNDLQSIIISTTLPVRNEFIPLSTGQKLQTVNPGIGTTGLSYISSIPVLIDYIVPVQQFGQQNQRIFYVPTAEFRWTDLISNLPIDRLSLAFYYQTINQNITPLMLAAGEYASIKILLKRIKN